MAEAGRQDLDDIAEYIENLEVDWLEPSTDAEVRLRVLIEKEKMHSDLMNIFSCLVAVINRDGGHAQSQCSFLHEVGRMAQNKVVEYLCQIEKINAKKKDV